MSRSAEDDRAAIEKLMRTYARLLDERRFAEWIDLFAEDGAYVVVTYENLQDQGLLLFKDDGREALKERAAFVMGYYQFERCKTLHVVSNVDVATPSSDETSSTSYFVIYRTPADGLPRLYSCGEYRDRLVRRNGRWMFQERLAIVDNNTLPENFTELI
ncbi:MAG TPA: nuclear transport factor 2 family protein [Candidatus Binataceae bacterium]|nr:nuclear transport factor 2 family protein [Candidatus Binataceae bacterium]